MDFYLSWVVMRILYDFFLSIPDSPHVRPREAVEAVVRHFAIVGVSEFQSVVPLALPVEKTRHALQHIVVHLPERAMSLCPVPSGASQNDFGASVLASAIMTRLATGDLSVGSFEAYIRDFTFVWLIPL